ncbi:MAG: hypothetical protein HC817_10245 [Saprospiraceae bacterium]|nr:hypothetical protein [Saprospiraceae bacterium]
MKIRNFVLAFIAVLAFNVAAFANPFIKPEAVATTISVLAEAKTVIINFANVVNDEVSVSIYDTDGNQLHTERINEARSASKKFNFSKVESGKYALVIIQKAVRTTQTFEVTKNEIILSEADRMVKYLPVLKQKEDKLDVFVPMVNSTVKVAILTNEGVKVFEKATPKVVSYAQRFDLSKLSSGVYVVEVQTDTETMYYTIKK